MSGESVDSLSGLAAFVRAAETRSYAAAARKLGVSASAVGKSVMRLEEKLGVKLLNRTTRSISLTAEGALFFERCRRLLADLADAEAELSLCRGAPRGRLRVSLPAAAYRLLSPALPAFVGAYPEVELDLDYNDRLVDVIDGGFDAVVRSGPLVDSRLMARRLGPFRLMVVGAPGYLKRRGSPARPEELSRHACLLYRFPSTGKVQAWQFDPGRLDAPPRLGAGLACNSVEALLAAARQGVGLAYLPDFAVREELERRKLVSVLGEYTTESGYFHALWPANRQASPKLRAFIEFLGERLAGPRARP